MGQRAVYLALPSNGKSNALGTRPQREIRVTVRGYIHLSVTAEATADGRLTQYGCAMAPPDCN